MSSWLYNAGLGQFMVDKTMPSNVLYAAPINLYSSNNCVGVNTSNPTYPLTVNGNMYLASNNYFYDSNTSISYASGQGLQFNSSNGGYVYTNGSVNWFWNASGFNFFQPLFASYINNYFYGVTASNVTTNSLTLNGNYTASNGTLCNLTAASNVTGYNGYFSNLAVSNISTTHSITAGNGTLGPIFNIITTPITVPLSYYVPFNQDFSLTSLYQGSNFSWSPNGSYNTVVYQNGTTSNRILPYAQNGFYYTPDNPNNVNDMNSSYAWTYFRLYILGYQTFYSLSSNVSSSPFQTSFSVGLGYYVNQGYSNAVYLSNTYNGSNTIICEDYGYTRGPCWNVTPWYPIPQAYLIASPCLFIENGISNTYRIQQMSIQFASQ